MLKIKKITRKNGQIEYYPVDHKFFYDTYFNIHCTPCINTEENAMKWLSSSDAERFRYFGATITTRDDADCPTYYSSSLEECREVLSYIKEYLVQERKHKQYLKEYFNGQKIIKEEFID